MSEIINCPSGLSGRIRGMKVREERILADRKLAKNGGQVVDFRHPSASLSKLQMNVIAPKH